MMFVIDSRVLFILWKSKIAQNSNVIYRSIGHYGRHEMKSPQNNSDVTSKWSFFCHICHHLIIVFFRFCFQTKWFVTKRCSTHSFERSSSLVQQNTSILLNQLRLLDSFHQWTDWKMYWHLNTCIENLLNHTAIFQYRISISNQASAIGLMLDMR